MEEPARGRGCCSPRWASPVAGRGLEEPRGGCTVSHPGELFPEGTRASRTDAAMRCPSRHSISSAHCLKPIARLQQKRFLSHKFISPPLNKLHLTAWDPCLLGCPTLFFNKTVQKRGICKKHFSGSSAAILQHCSAHSRLSPRAARAAQQGHSYDTAAALAANAAPFSLPHCCKKLRRVPRVPCSRSSPRGTMFPTPALSRGDFCCVLQLPC